jgi:hypothetical protein
VASEGDGGRGRSGGGGWGEDGSGQGRGCGWGEDGSGWGVGNNWGGSEAVTMKDQCGGLGPGWLRASIWSLVLD